MQTDLVHPALGCTEYDQPKADDHSLTAIKDSLYDGEDLDPEFKVLVRFSTILSSSFR